MADVVSMFNSEDGELIPDAYIPLEQTHDWESGCAKREERMGDRPGPAGHILPVFCSLSFPSLGV